MFEHQSIETKSYGEALDKLGLNFRVDLAPVFANIGGENKQVIGKYATYRTDTNEPLNSIVGSRYNVIQQTDLGNIADSIIKPLDASYVNGGLLRGGNVFFVQAKLPNNWKIGNKDLIGNYLTLMGSHDGLFELTMGFSSIQAACWNTFVAAMEQAKAYVCIRHTASSDYKLTQSENILKSALDYFEGVQIKANQLADRQFNQSMMNEALKQIFNVTDTKEPSTKAKNDMNKIMDIWQYGANAQATPELVNTAWGAFSALTDYADHTKTIRGDSETARLESVMLGSALTFKAKAFDVINSMV